MTVIDSITSQPPPQRTGSERRTHYRRRTLLSGQLAFNNGWGALDCTVRDLSEGGAKIEIGSWLNLPRELELYLDRGDRFRCERVRYIDNLMGVRFLDAAKAAA